MNAFRVLVADDEAPARSKVIRFLASDARFELIGEARNGREAVAQIRALSPDLLILDIQMPGLSGFDVLESAGAEACPKVIFSTAFDQYALKAFEAHAVDYLLKPYDAARFQQALDHASRQLDRGTPDAAALKALLLGLQRDAGPVDRLLVKTDEAWVPLNVASVSHLCAEGKQVRVHTDKGPQLLRQSLKSLETRLDPKRFVRIHRGDLVNLEFVTRLEPWTHGDGLVVMKDGSALVLSRSYREEFLRRWGLRD